MRLVHFLQYNNAVPIAVSVLMLGAGGTFAATNPEAIYSSTQQVVSVDNSYIVNKDLSAYSPQAQITAVTEDGDNYYVAYDFYTIDLADGVWRDVVKRETMTVSKAFLGQYRDLGVYVTEQIKQNVDAEMARLHDTQDIERKNVTQKVVATSYGGLIGQLLDTSTQVVSDYTPVTESIPVQQVASAGQTQTDGNSGDSAGGNPSAQIGLQLLGNNPAVISLHTSYSDLGAVLIDPLHQNVGIHVFQNGAEVMAPTVDTSTTSVATIEYRATDLSGTTVTVRRVVLIGGAQDPGGEITTAGNTIVTAPVSTPLPAPQPIPNTASAVNSDTSTTTTSTTTSTTTGDATSDAATSTAAEEETSTDTATSTSGAADTASVPAETATTTVSGNASSTATN
jgi:hypothetical protein